ncbi:hypothetical protein pdam_00014411, partial [Pocillopora damicornis]
LSMLGQGEPYALECVSGLEELASVSGDEEENGLTFALYVVQDVHHLWEELAGVKTSTYILTAGPQEYWLMKLVGTMWLLEENSHVPRTHLRNKLAPKYLLWT